MSDAEKKNNMWAREEDSTPTADFRSSRWATKKLCRCYPYSPPEYFMQATSQMRPVSPNSLFSNRHHLFSRGQRWWKDRNGVRCLLEVELENQFLVGVQAGDRPQWIRSSKDY
jgi:hypothetical protein